MSFALPPANMELGQWLFGKLIESEVLSSLNQREAMSEPCLVGGSWDIRTWL